MVCISSILVLKGDYDFMVLIRIYFATMPLKFYCSIQISCNALGILHIHQRMSVKKNHFFWNAPREKVEPKRFHPGAVLKI